ncbi:hypothetical protein LJC58_09455 [Lachnospiraceae bacterium OttesenSCG-928-D06]|nr:hypothetical protein [Lachnospiraceae bacterium OttesenSCG-928-D06]
MFHQKIKLLFHSAVSNVVSSISDYVLQPGKDFTRNKKLPPDQLISFLVSQGASSTRNKRLDFFLWKEPSQPLLP